MNRFPLYAIFYFALALLAGCSIAPEITGLKIGSVSASYRPAPGSEAFGRIGFQNAKSVAVLAIKGDDARSAMNIITLVLLKKGYAVRNVDMTVRALRRANLLQYRPADPEMIDKAARIFDDDLAVSGKVSLIGREPVRITLDLYWFDLRSRKRVWTVKSFFSGRRFSGAGPYESAVRETIRESLLVVPRSGY
ncbi:MAG: hypothetical protein V3V56_06065 [bacterium]